MTRRHGVAALGLATMLLGVAPAPRAEIPEPGLREQQWSRAAADRAFEAGRFEQALAAFEAASRDGPAFAPPEMLRRWGIAAAESGWHLAAVIRLGQYLDTRPAAPDRDLVQARVARSRSVLLAAAPRRSRVVVTSERRPDQESPGERHVVRLVSRDRRATLEGLSGSRAPLWQRAGDIAPDSYMDLVRRLLAAPELRAELPAQEFDPNDAGPRRAVTLRLVIGDEERSLQALRGAPLEQLSEMVSWVLQFAHTAPRAGE
ncbi:MAG TPA: hypothetical protein VML54_11530 [Candidatus Limnocylindrales bacterium]|nr:hypothetical protein [Candidatus Limnocylindrales bacterium]